VAAVRDDVPDGRDAVALRSLREALERAEFTVDAVEERLGTHELSARPADIAVHRHRLDEADAFSTFARLFLLGDAVDGGSLASAVAPGTVEQLAALRVVASASGLVRPLVRLVPHGDYFIASDAGPEAGADVPFDHVPGIQSPSVTLAKLAVRRPCRAALDLGTGCGIQALLASKHAERVVATDINPRALAFAAFNAALNSIDTIEFRAGDGFDPVGEERLDLIVANPPYVISPDTTFAYRDSGLPVDELCRRIVGEAATHLADDGFAHILVSWAATSDDDWSAPLRPWVAESGCDVWLMHYGTSDPVAHAAGWLRPLGESDPDLHTEALERWLAYLGDSGIDAVGYGAVVLHRRESERNWVRTDPLPLDRLEPASDHTLRVFAAQDALEILGDEELLDRRLTLVDSHRLRQTLHAEEGRLTVEEQTIELTDGLCFAVGVDRHTASLLPRLDGRRSLREVLELARATVELTAEEKERFVPAALPVVRRLLALGFLELR
jgi:methylase of polypeptide subunit release factors